LSLIGLKLFVALKICGKADFQNLIGLSERIIFSEKLTVIYDSIQFDELIPNITLVLRQNVLIFSKPAIPVPKPGFLGYLLFCLCSLIQHGAIIKDKSHTGE
jgi:hypothetical protein